MYLSDVANSPSVDEDEADDTRSLAQREADNWASFGDEALSSGRGTALEVGFGDNFSAAVDEVSDFDTDQALLGCRLSVITVSDDSDFLDCESLDAPEEKEESGSIGSSSLSDGTFYSFESSDVEIEEDLEISQHIEDDAELEVARQDESTSESTESDDDSVSGETVQDSGTIDGNHRIERIATIYEESESSEFNDSDGQSSVKSEPREESIETPKENSVSEVHVGSVNHLSVGSLSSDNSIDFEESPAEVEIAAKEKSPLTLFTVESARNMFKKWKADRMPSHELVYNIDIPREDPRIPSDGSTRRSRYVTTISYINHVTLNLLIVLFKLKAQQMAPCIGASIGSLTLTVFLKYYLI